MIARTHPIPARRRAVAWFAALVVLAACLGGSAALIRLAVSGYRRGELQVEADRIALEVGRGLSRFLGQDATEMGLSPSGSIASTELRTRSVGDLPDMSVTITLGQWDVARRQFQPGDGPVNAVAIVAQGAFDRSSAPWLARLFVPDQTPGRTHAVAAVQPRDIVFVVDLSSTMTAQTRQALEALLRAGAADPAYPEDDRLRELYADLGYDAYPGTLEPFGAPWQVGQGKAAYARLTAEDGPLADPAASDPYRIHAGDSAGTRRRKAYRAVIDRQITRLMPQARPAPDRPENFDYWAAYLDDVLDSGDGYRIGYASHIRFMLEHGRSIPAGGQHVPLSQFSDDCPWNPDLVEKTAPRFPPRTQPMHDVRRGLVAALQDLTLRNRGIQSPLQRDRVAIATFDSLAPNGAWIEQPLTSDYAAAANKAAKLQAVGSRAVATSGLPALKLAESLLRRSAAATPRNRHAGQMIVFVSAEEIQADSPLQSQIAEMARIGQTVQVIRVGTQNEEVAERSSVAAGPVSSHAESRSLQTRRVSDERCDTESTIKATVAAESAVLVQ
ncbi:MAG: hypothetical protein GXX96_20855 [Planctomycetaceae bacterium]|nr:hypothetical protein [Planctomycetaceae bacterium]